MTVIAVVSGNVSVRRISKRWVRRPRRRRRRRRHHPLPTFSFSLSPPSCFSLSLPSTVSLSFTYSLSPMAFSFYPTTLAPWRRRKVFSRVFKGKVPWKNHIQIDYKNKGDIKLQILLVLRSPTLWASFNKVNIVGREDEERHFQVIFLFEILNNSFKNI